MPHYDIAMNGMAATAFLYAYRGWAVLPLFGTRDGVCRCPKGSKCKNPGRHPLTRGGVKDATTNLFTIKSWWSKWPSANIGIATGKQSGIVLIDIDSKGEGQKSKLAIEKKLGPLPDTLAVKPSLNQRQMIYRYPTTKIGDGIVQVAPGLDLLSDGAYFLAPRSRNAADGRVGWIKGKSIRSMGPALLTASWLKHLS